MRGLRANISRRDALLVAAALLVPILVVAQSGLGVSVPSVVERGIGSLVTVQADDGRGTSVTGVASGGSEGGQQSGAGSLRITRRRRSIRAAIAELPGMEATTPSASDRAGGDPDGGSPPAGGTEEPPDQDAAADQPRSAPSANESGPPAQGATVGLGEPSPSDAEVSVEAESQAASAGITASASSIGVEFGVDQDGTGSEPSATAGVTTAEGSHSQFQVAPPPLQLP
jgi:hypothetical protein